MCLNIILTLVINNFFVIEWGCVACEGSAFFFVFNMQSMQLPEKYPKRPFLPLYEEELKI